MQTSAPRVVRTDSIRRQRTLARRVDVAGFGFWTGQDVVYSFRPAPDDSGVRFFRDDLPNAPAIAAVVANRVKKPRQTSLAVGSAQVDMVEHALAALRAARIDNCDVVVSAPEAPGMDGSGAAFLRAFLEAGTVEQTKERATLKVVESGVLAGEGFGPGAKIDVAPSAEGRCVYEYNLIYDVPGAIPSQSAEFDFARSPEDFLAEIGGCRTFLTLAEANELRKMGICQRVTERDALVFDAGAPIDNPLRFPNECARHKLLDMVGDFSLAPYDWIGEFRASRTGHQQNANALAQVLAGLA